MCLRKLTLEKIKYGVIVLPRALIEAIIVTSNSRSADIAEPICFTLFDAAISQGVCNAEHPSLPHCK